MNRISPTVKQLLIINIIFYFGSSFSLNTEFIYSLFSLHFPENPEFKFWQLLTHVYAWGYFTPSFQYVCSMDVWICN